MLDAKNLTYSGIIDGLNFQLRPGEMVALVGSNGAGKSTLVRLLAGVLKPDSGTITIETPESQSNQGTIGLVFQNPETQFVANTVEEEVAFGPGQLEVSRSELELRVSKALEQVGLSDRAHWQSHALSAGQKQRLALASVLALKPRYLLLDEPTSMLDPPSRLEFRELLQTIRSEVGVLWVTHRAEEVHACDRVVRLDRGRITQEYSREELLAQPATSYAALDMSLPSTLQLRAFRGHKVPNKPYESQRTSHVPAAAVWASFTSVGHTYARQTPLQHRALTDLSCRFPTGKITAIIGATGSGKSTLLQHLNLLLRPQEGTLKLLSETVTDQTHPRPLRKRIGLLFQQPESQFFQETCWDEVAYAPSNFGLPVEASVSQALTEVKLDPKRFAKRSPFELSGGEQRRLALAAVLAYQPEVVVLDEPTAGLDPTQRQNIWELLIDLKARGRSLVLVSHDLDEVGELADHLIWLEQGKVRLEGDPELLYRELHEAGFELPPWCQHAYETLISGPLPIRLADYVSWAEMKPLPSLEQSSPTDSDSEESRAAES